MLSRRSLSENVSAFQMNELTGGVEIGRTQFSIYIWTNVFREPAHALILHALNEPRPPGYCFSQLRPSMGLIFIPFTVSESMQRALTLNPSGCERGT